jgi:hypothetical protein
MRFYHSEQEWPGTLKAIPSGVPRPNAAACVSSCLAKRVSLLEWDECAGYIRGVQRPDGPSGCRSLHPGIGFADVFSVSDVPRQSPRWFVPTVSCRGDSHPRSQFPTARLVRRKLCCVSCRFSLDPWDLARFYPPKTRLGQGTVRALPIPAHGSGLVAFGHQDRHDSFHHTALVPSLEPIVGRALRTEFFRQLVPLATRPHPKDDRVEHLPPFRRRSPRLLARPKLRKDRFNAFPKRIGNFPYHTQHHFLFRSTFFHSWLSLTDCPRMT